MARSREQREGREKGTYDLEALEELLAALIEASGQGRRRLLREGGIFWPCAPWASPVR